MAFGSGGFKSEWSSLTRLDEKQAYADGYKKIYDQTQDHQKASAAGSEALAAFRASKPAETEKPAEVKQTMQNPFNSRAIFGRQVQMPFTSNRAKSQVTDEDRTAAAWQKSELSGKAYFDSLDEAGKKSYAPVYEQALAGGMSHIDAMAAAQQANEKAQEKLKQAADRKILMENASEDVNSVMGVSAFKRMSTEDQDAVLQGWSNGGGVDGIYRALKEIGAQDKYSIYEGWNRSGEGFTFREPETAEPQRSAAEINAELEGLDETITQRALDRGMSGDIDDETLDSLMNDSEKQRRATLLAELEQAEAAEAAADKSGAYSKPEKPDTSEIVAQITALYKQLDETELAMEQQGKTRQLTARRNAIGNEIEKLEQQRDSLNAKYEAPLQQSQDELLKQLDQIANPYGKLDYAGADLVRGTTQTALNALAKGWHKTGADALLGLAYGAEQIEKAVGLSDAVSGYLRRGEKFYRSMQKLAEADIQKGNETALQGVTKVMALLTDEKTALEAGDDAKAVVDWISDHVVVGTFENIGHMMPGLFLDVMSGGITGVADVVRIADEAAGAWGGRTLIQQLAGGIQAAMSNPGFGATFAGEYFGNLAEAIDAGEQPTGTDMVWNMAGSFISALIEYGGGDVASGFQAVLMDELSGLKGFVHSEIGESVEEVTQEFTKRVSENIAYALQNGGQMKYELYNDGEPGTALINLAEIWETCWQTWISTAGMSGVHYVAGTLANGIVKVNRGEELTQDDRLFDNVIVIPMTKDFKSRITNVAGAVGPKTERSRLRGAIRDGRSMAYGGTLRWSVHSRKLIYLQSDSGKFDEYDEIRAVAKHEFGHVLGLGDLYESAPDHLPGVDQGTYRELDGYSVGEKAYNLVMCDHFGPVSNNDIEMIVLAFRENRAQLYQPDRVRKHISKALGKGN